MRRISLLPFRAGAIVAMLAAACADVRGTQVLSTVPGGQGGGAGVGGSPNPTGTGGGPEQGGAAGTAGEAGAAGASAAAGGVGATGGGGGAAGGSPGAGGGGVGAAGGVPAVECGKGLQQGAPWPMRGRCVGHGSRSPYPNADAKTVSWATPLGGPQGTAPVAGAEKWAFFVKSPIYSTPAIGADGTLYFVGLETDLYAVTSDGSEKWTASVGGKLFNYSSPALGADGTVFIGDTGPSPGALDAFASDGTKTWMSPTVGYVLASPIVGGNGTVYFGDTPAGGFLYAASSKGKPLWKRDLHLGGSSPAIGSDGTLYVHDFEGMLTAIVP